MALNPYTLWYFIPAMLGMALSFYGFRRRLTAIAAPFGLLMLALALWCFCHALSVASTTLSLVLFWTQIQYLGIVAVGPCWLMFALAHAGREAWATTPLRLVMAALALVTFLAVMTNQAHGLWWTQLAFDSTKPFGTLAVVRGPLFWAHAALTYSYLLGGIGLFIQRAFDASQFYRRQVGIIVTATLIPLVGNIALLAGWQIPFADDPTPLLLLVSAVILFWAARRYDLLNLAPIAHRQVFESIPDGVIALDRAHIVNTANSAARQFLPAQLHEWAGQPISNLLRGSPLDVDVAHMLANHTVPQTRRVRYNQAAMLHCVEIRLQPLFASSYNHAGALLMLRDMSEQVRAEQARDQRLREVSLLQQIARSANSALQTDDVLRVISRETLRALPWHRIAVGLLQSNNATLRMIADYKADGGTTLDGRYIDVQNFDLIISVMHAGSPRAFQVNDPLLRGTATEAALRQMGIQTVLFLPLLDRERPLGMLFVGSLGERTIPDEELRMFDTIAQLVSDTILRTQLYEATQEASNLKSAFLATVSHELRTPLTSIIGFTDMLQAHILGPLPDSATAAVDSIQRGSHILLRLINNILDFSKMEAGHFTVDLYPVDLHLIVQIVTMTLQPQLAERGLKLSVNLPPNLPLIQANSTRLEQVLMNLLANAIKFTEAGEIVISARCEAARVRISVRDTGIGIASQFQNHIFDAFRQVENPLTRRYGGTGLGLAISRRLVDLMGGTISVESELGAGSVFSCEFHAAFEPQPMPAYAGIDEQIFIAS